MRSKATSAARILLGLIFFVFGLNGLVHFIPVPPMTGAAGMLMTGFGASGYFFPLLASTQTIAGTALLARRFVPLALVVLAPVIVNIVAIHLFLVPSGLVVALLVLFLEIFLAWSYRESFRTVLHAHDSVSQSL